VAPARTARSVPLSAGLAALVLTFAVTACAAEPDEATSTTDKTAAPTATATATPDATVSASPSPAASPAASPPAEPPAEPPAQEEPMSYRDGQYSARGWYGGLPSHHDVTLTVENDTVTAVEITTPAEDETSLGYQQRFADALPGAIVGRDIDELVIDRLAGSSGCSEGFLNALAEIKAAAAS
jgi:hypothetical protein